MDADAEAQALAELDREALVQRAHALVDAARGGERLPRRLARIGVGAEDRHHAGADELVGYAAGCADRVAHRLEEQLRHVAGILGQLLLRKAGAAAELAYADPERPHQP